MAGIKARDLLLGRNLESQVTPRHVFEGRRTLLLSLPGLGLQASGGFLGSAAAMTAAHAQTAAPAGLASLAVKPSRYSVMDKPVSFAEATGYNNFYEFGFDKDDPAARAPGRLKTNPWQVKVDGLVTKPRVFDIDDLRKLAPLEERISRLRCVEGWSMVIPWVGYSFSELIRQVQPLGSAKYVEFTSLADPQQMPNLSSRVLRWPYVEALRMDEAQHPLTFLTLGMYGVVLPAQNGAPVRMVMPWKYGFKSAKSIVRIRFLESQPATSWALAAPQEYGFYANVNPEVSHPRWSQATERVLGTGSVFSPRRKTEMFNGYAELIGNMYAGLDLRKFY